MPGLTLLAKVPDRASRHPFSGSRAGNVAGNKSGDPRRTWSGINNRRLIAPSLAMSRNHIRGLSQREDVNTRLLYRRDAQLDRSVRIVQDRDRGCVLHDRSCQCQEADDEIVVAAHGVS